MAVRFRKGRASPWQCYWNNPFTGKRESESFPTKEDAEKHDSLIKHRLKYDRESFQQEEEEITEEPGGITLEAGYLMYLKEKKFDKASLKWQLQGMRIPLSRFGQCPISDITEEDIRGMMGAMLLTGVKPVTVRNRFTVLKAVMRWCARNHLCPKPDFPPLPPEQYQKFVPPTPDEINAILKVAPPHIARVVILGAQFGVRVGPCELMQLTWDDVDFTKNILRVHGSKKNRNSPWREVPIRESLRDVFLSWREQDMQSGVTYLIHYGGKPIKNISWSWRKTVRRAGIQRNIRPYDLRHAFGTEMVAAGVDIGTVAKLMGHSNPMMLLSNYQYVMDRQKRDAVESLPDIEYVPKSMCPKIQNVTTDYDEEILPHQP